MQLKSLAEIAFDAFQCFADGSKRFPLGWNDLHPIDKMIFERIAGRVHAEVLLRMHPDENDIPMSRLDKP